MRIGLSIRIAAAAALAVLLAVELGFGTWLSRDPIDRLNLPRDFQATAPAQGLYPGGEDFVYRRDHWGFRGAIDPVKVRVVTLGGDAADQSFLPENATWQAAMARALAEQGPEPVIANAGLAGQGIQGQISALQAWLPWVPGLKPQFVVALTGLEDAEAGGTAPDRLPQSRLLKRSGFARLAARVGRPRLKPPHHPVDWTRARWTASAGGDAAIDTGAYKQRVERLADMIHAMGAVPVFVTQARADVRLVDGKPMGLAADNGPNGLDHHRRLARINAATLAVCADKGLLCLDLARELKFGDGDFYDAVHHTPQGAEKVGRWLADKLAGLV